jgi:hypothetical protein
MSFAYNASAVALGGRIVLPSPTIIQSQASVALAPTGGVGTQTISNFNYNGIITFDEASAYVSGSSNQDSTVFSTLSTVTIRNLNVLNVLQVDRLVGSITSHHDKGAPEGHITFQGTSVDNLRIAGRAISPRFNLGFYSRYSTHQALADGLKGTVDQCDCPEVKAWLDEEVAKERAKGDPQFNEANFRHDLGRRNVACLVADRFCWKPSDAVNGAPDDHGNIHCSLADDIPGIEEVTEPDPSIMTAAEQLTLRQQHPVRRSGYVIKVAGFGTIKLAEIIIKPGERRINMFRLEFGCPTTGDMTVGSASTNGTELVP